MGFCDYGGDNNTSAVRRKRLAMRKYCLFRDTPASRRTWRSAGGGRHVRGEGYNVSLVSYGMRRSSDLRGSVIIKKSHLEVEFFIMVEDK